MAPNHETSELKGSQNLRGQHRQGLKGGSSSKHGEPDTPLCFYMSLSLADSNVQSGTRARCPQFAMAGILMVKVQGLFGGISSSGLAWWIMVTVFSWALLSIWNQTEIWLVFLEEK